jgi:methionyl-tRNA synthetase
MGVERLDDADGSVTFVLPYDVPANEFLNLEGDKFSGKCCKRQRRC